MRSQQGIFINENTTFEIRSQQNVCYDKFLKKVYGY